MRIRLRTGPALFPGQLCGLAVLEMQLALHALVSAESGRRLRWSAPKRRVHPLAPIFELF